MFDPCEVALSVFNGVKWKIFNGVTGIWICLALIGLILRMKSKIIWASLIFVTSLLAIASAFTCLVHHDIVCVYGYYEKISLGSTSFSLTIVLVYAAITSSESKSLKIITLLSAIVSIVGSAAALIACYDSSKIWPALSMIFNTVAILMTALGLFQDLIDQAVLLNAYNTTIPQILRSFYEHEVRRPFLQLIRSPSRYGWCIGTHSGKFHCDEVFAVSMLKLLPEFKDHDIVRTRDPTLLEQCDIVVDVGGVFDHEKKRYDHHQKEFVHTMQSLGILDFTTKLSSAGLVFAQYGQPIIAEILGLKHDDRMIPIFYRKIYETYVEQIDAVDNGIPQYDGIPKYMTSGGISGRVGHLNPHWNEPDADADERFKKAMQLIGGDFEEAVKYLRNVWWPAREIVEKAVDDRFNVDASGRIVLLDTESGAVPWKEHFFTITAANGITGHKMTYMLFQDNTNKQWRIEATNTTRHTSLIGVQNTREGAIKQARKSLKDEAKKTNGR